MPIPMVSAKNTNQDIHGKLERFQIGRVEHTGQRGGRAKSTSGNTNMAVSRLMMVGAAFALASFVLRRPLSDASIEDRSSVRPGNGFQGGVIPDHLTTCPDPTHRARLR